VTLRRHSKSLEINHSKGRTLLHRSYRLFYISSEIQRYIGRKSLFFYTPRTFDVPIRESLSAYWR